MGYGVSLLFDFNILRFVPLKNAVENIGGSIFYPINMNFYYLES